MKRPYKLASLAKRSVNIGGTTTTATTTTGGGVKGAGGASQSRKAAESRGGRTFGVHSWRAAPRKCSCVGRQKRSAAAQRARGETNTSPEKAHDTTRANGTRPFSGAVHPRQGDKTKQRYMSSQDAQAWRRACARGSFDGDVIDRGLSAAPSQRRVRRKRTHARARPPAIEAGRRERSARSAPWDLGRAPRNH